MEIIPTTKIINRDGIKAIKNGQKFNKFSEIPSPKKPSWLKVKAEFNPNFQPVSIYGRSLNSKWNIIYTFASSKINHIHNIVEDKYDDIFH